MSQYDDMRAEVTPNFVAGLYQTKLALASNAKDKRNSGRRTLVWVLLALLLSPSCASPVILRQRSLPHNSRSSSRSSSSSSTISKSNSNSISSLNSSPSSSTSLSTAETQILHLGDQYRALEEYLARETSVTASSSSSPSSSSFSSSSSVSTSVAGSPETQSKTSRIGTHQSSLLRKLVLRSSSSSTPQQRLLRVTRSAAMDSTTRELHWSQPCHTSTMARLDQTLPTSELSKYIFTNVQRSLSHINTFQDDFAKKTLKYPDWSNAVLSLGTMVERPSYLPDIPLDLASEDVGRDVLDSISFQTELVKVYEYLQRYAVGIEQVTLDQALYKADFLKQFRDLELNLVTLLCEVKNAMAHRGLTPNDTITKDIMSTTARDSDSETQRNNRDFVIMKEYIRGLRYMEDVFNHFMKSEAAA